MTEYSTNLMILLNDYFRIIFKLIVENLVKTEWLIISNPPCPACKWEQRKKKNDKDQHPI